MILYDTPQEKVIETILDEIEKIQYVARKKTNEIIRFFENETDNNKAYIYQYTIPSSKNTYTITAKLVGENIGICYYLKVDGVKCRRKVFSITTDTLFTFTGHFLSRYRERSGSSAENVDELIHEVLTQVLDGQYYPAGLLARDDIALMLENLGLDMRYKKGKVIFNENECIYEIANGICFFDVSSATFKNKKYKFYEFKTFVGRNGMRHDQKVSSATVKYAGRVVALKEAKKNGTLQEEFIRIIKNKD